MPSADGRAGFTLIEMMAVMAIIALMSSVVITAMPGTGRAGLNALALQTAALLRRERFAAIVTKRDHQVSLDGESRVLLGESGGAVVMPRDVVVDVLGVDGLRADGSSVVRFHPDGASSGAVLRLSRDSAGYEVRVNWYLGSVTVEPL